MPTATASAPSVSMQGIAIPASSVDANAFAAATRRQNLLMKTLSAFAGFGSTDLIPILQTGIISRAIVRVFGTLVITTATGAVASTSQWPYNLIRQLRFTANGQSNLINCSGWGLKLLSQATRMPLDDRGVSQGINGASPGNATTQGTFSMASESWGVGQNVSAIPAGSYDVELIYEVPIAYDQVSLLGAIFAQTASTDLELAIDWNLLATLFTVTGTSTVTFVPSVTVEATVYTIPAAQGGGIVVPNLSAFHSVTESRNAVIANGINETLLAGQGVGRQLMRLAFRAFNAGSPMPLSAANFGQLYWRYGGNTTPEQFADGRMLRQWDEALYNTDVGGPQGYGVFDFSSLYAPRDSIDEGSATQLRFGVTIPTSVTLATPYLEYIQEAIVAGATGAT